MSSPSGGAYRVTTIKSSDQIVGLGNNRALFYDNFTIRAVGEESDDPTTLPIVGIVAPGV